VVAGRAHLAETDVQVGNFEYFVDSVDHCARTLQSCILAGLVELGVHVNFEWLFYLLTQLHQLFQFHQVIAVVHTYEVAGFNVAAGDVDEQLALFHFV